MLFLTVVHKLTLTDAVPRETSIAREPAPIVDDWPALKQAGFTVVDALLLNPANPDQIFVFSGEQYVLVNVASGTLQSLCTSTRIEH